MPNDENTAQTVDNIYSSLREMMLDNDPYALRHETQETLVSLFRAIGKMLAHDPTATIPELDDNLIIDAARHSGNNVLSNVGSDQQYQIRQFADSGNTDYAKTIATSFLLSLVDNWYTQLALSAYRDTAEEDSDERDRLQKAVEDFQRIAKLYHSGLVNDFVGMRALLLAATTTDAVPTLCRDVHESITVPWFLNIAEYNKYVAAICMS
jgi:hypothetical protein